MTSESDRLLQPTGISSVTVPHPSSSSDVRARQVGPLEISTETRYGILAGVWIATFLSSLNQTLVPTMLPSISSEFNKSNQASWLGTAYLLSVCTFTPLYGRLCNAMGRKSACILALSFFGAGILGCGLSTNMEMLIAARFISGIGGGGLHTVSSIIISDMYDMRSRGLTTGVAAVFNSLGQGLGGPLGGLMTDWMGWRGAFLIQLPLFILSFGYISYFLCYVTPEKGRSTKEILLRIDYGGSFALLTAVGSILVFLSSRYNEGLPWTHPTVVVPLVLTAIGSLAFILIELHISVEPVLAPFLLIQKIPILVGLSNFLIAMCNFSVMYFFPMWFQTVVLTNTSTAGLHLVPNSIGLSTGSVFAGYMMHRTGNYKRISSIFGFLPFIGAIFMSRIREDSGPFLTWFCIFPLGFGNAVIVQTTLIALLAHLPESQLAVGTGFIQLFRGIGQVGGVAFASALFQSRLGSELHKRIQTPDAEELILKIRHSARYVTKLPPDLQAKARESYAVSLRAVFTCAAIFTFLGFIVRMPIPDKHLNGANPTSQGTDDPRTRDSEAVSDEDPGLDETSSLMPKRRRLSGYESASSILADE